MTNDEKEAWKLVRGMQREQGFQELDPRVLTRLSDAQLATLQSGFSPSTPQYIRAEHEWQRRLVGRQVRSAYWTTTIAAVFGLLGTVLGWWLAQRSQHRADRYPAAQSPPAPHAQAVQSTP